MKALLKQLVIQFKMDIRERGVLMTFYMVPLIFYAVMGSVFASINPASKETLAASMAIFAVTMGAVLGIPAPLIKLREQGVLRAWCVNGIPGPAILLTQALSAMIHLIVVAGIISLSAPALFGASIPANGWAFALILLLTILASTAIGLLIGVTAKNNAVSIMISQLVFLPSLLLGGLMFPSSMLPQALQVAGNLFPATHAMNAFLNLCYHQPAVLTVPVSLGIIALMALFCAAGTGLRFAKINKID